MKYILILFLIINSFVFSQTPVDNTAKPIGGIENFEFVFQSQLIYPEILLKKNINRDVAIYFEVLKDGKVCNIEFKEDYEKEFKQEATRLLRYIIFQPASIGNVNVDSKTFLVFKFNTNTYKKYCKQRGFIIHKEMNLFDTSFVVYDRADVSPEYYKGEEALGEYILANLEYPDLAVRQNLQGTVLLSFIVEPNGNISNIVVEKEFNHLCTNEAIKVLKNTKWKAGKKDGKLIRYKTKYPIIFNLNNVNKDNATSEQR
jgi:TonB family protein